MKRVLGEGLIPVTGHTNSVTFLLMKWVSGEAVIPVTDHTNSVTFLSVRWVLGEGAIPGSHQLGYTSLGDEGFR